jgi:hypothetical protein
VLLRRILASREAFDIQISRPFRVKRNQVVREGELERAVLLAIEDRADAACVLVLLDADADCPVELGAQLLERCERVTQLPIAVVLANREFEAWYLAAKESLRGFRGVRDDAVAPASPDAISDAKGELSRNMAGNRYLEVDDQPAFAEHFDLEMAAGRSGSFRKLLREIERLVALTRG